MFWETFDTEVYFMSQMFSENYRHKKSFSDKQSMFENFRLKAVIKLMIKV
jgi:hypothetical protein